LPGTLLYSHNEDGKSYTLQQKRKQPSITPAKMFNEVF